MGHRSFQASGSQDKGVSIEGRAGKEARLTRNRVCSGPIGSVFGEHDCKSAAKRKRKRQSICLRIEKGSLTVANANQYG